MFAFTGQYFPNAAVVVGRSTKKLVTTSRPAASKMEGKHVKMNKKIVDF